MMKKTLIPLAVCGALSSISGTEIIVSPFGYLTGMYQSAPTDNFAFHVRSGADFNINNSGFSFGLGAIGLWNIPLDSNQPSNSVGDISDAYIQYKRRVRTKEGNTKETLQASIGRFNSDFLRSDWLAGNIQGIGARYSVSNRFDLYASYLNSYLNTGYKRGQVGTKYGTSIANLTPFSPNTKDRYVGGEVIMAGISFTEKQKFLFDIFGLLNSSLPNTLPAVPNGNRGSSLLGQVGATISFKIATSQEGFQARTTLRGLAQYGNTDRRDAPDRLGQDFSFLAWADEKLTIYNDFYIGAGAHYVGGREGMGGIWSITDMTRYYGNTMGLASTTMGYIAPYFFNNTITAYVYGGIDYKRFTLHALASFIDYQEFSLMAQYRFWEQGAMSLEVGGGFIHYKFDGYNTQAAIPYYALVPTSQNSFNVFVRFNY